MKKILFIILSLTYYNCASTLPEIKDMKTQLNERIVNSYDLVQITIIQHNSIRLKDLEPAK